MRHYDPLRPHRFDGIPDRYEFTHGTNSVCVYEAGSMRFVREVPVGERPDCHATSRDNRYLYMACGAGDGGLWCLDQETLSVARVVDTGWVYATNVMPGGSTMLLHDSFGGVLVVKDIQDMARIHVHRRLDVLETNRWMDTLGGKGHFLDEGRRYLCAGWHHADLYVIDLRDLRFEVFAREDPALRNGDDLVIHRDRSRAYVACYADRQDSYAAVVDLADRRVVKTIPTGRGTCGLTMTNDERHVIASNDADDSISVIDTELDAVAVTLSARPLLEERGLTGYIQGISIGADDEVFVYGCSGNGALVRFRNILGEAECTVSSPGECASGPALRVERGGA